MDGHPANDGIPVAGAVGDRIDVGDGAAPELGVTGPASRPGDWWGVEDLGGYNI